MNVCVIGAGAVGGYFGARLAEHGVAVTFLVRAGRFQQLQTRGLRVYSPYGDIVLTPQLALHPEAVQEPGLVLLAVKNYQLEGVLASLSVLASRGAWVLPLLNGIRHLDVLRSVVPAPQLLGGTCHIEATLNEHGDIVHANTLQNVIFGPLPKTD
ncbi:MAG: ketopantoate reductase family protein, partial [Alicyclobacillus sp.]|nr:ketopantoate reductase family protein [Alicyclobacillus sp.]